ncbi:hypothetical protein SAMN05421857_0264 [Chryseobacterium formosense]|nr:hypothetical protein SAMN05421857_0264 [Chryseobacterium formosense]
MYLNVSSLILIDFLEYIEDYMFKINYVIILFIRKILNTTTEFLIDLFIPKYNSDVI